MVAQLKPLDSQYWKRKRAKIDPLLKISNHQQLKKILESYVLIIERLNQQNKLTKTFMMFMHRKIIQIKPQFHTLRLKMQQMKTQSYHLSTQRINFQWCEEQTLVSPSLKILIRDTLILKNWSQSKILIKNSKSTLTWSVKVLIGVFFLNLVTLLEEYANITRAL